MWESIVESLAGSGPAVVIIAMLVLAGNVLGWWVWGYVHQREIREKEYWRDKALEMLGLGEEVAEVASEIAEETS